ncbi:RNA polymerase sigma factor [bacterium]|nr:RNA polymerase sigma factor [bacterium]
MTEDSKKYRGSSDAIDTSASDETAKELELIRLAVQGNSAAKTEIVLKHQQNVYNLGLRLTGNEDEASCVLQDTFLKVFEKLDGFQAKSRLGTWIHRIAANEALMRMRSRKNKYFVPIEEEKKDEESSYDIGFIATSLELDPLESTLNEELKVHLEEAIQQLPANLRTAFVLKDLEGLSMAEIAEEVGKTVSAIKADLHRARVRLRERLVEFVNTGSE